MVSHASRRPQPKKRSPRASSALRAYRRKRDLAASGEPAGQRDSPRRADAPLSYVIQMHDARRLHYDLRLEMDDVYKSWAVPKGLPTKRGEKVLAVAVEDHPLDYGSFEGVIPEGNYGAGTVMVWDRGVYAVVGEAPVEAYRQGKIHFVLAGEKCRGEWTLVRMKASEGERANWLLFKTGETGGRTPVKAAGRDRSVQSGRTLAEIARAGVPANATAEATTHAAPKRKARRRPTDTKTKPKPSRPNGAADFVEPMRALATTTLPRGDWRLEVKFDGYRAVAVCRGKNVRLWSRNHESMNEDFPEVIEALQRINIADAVIDGEIAALDKNGRSVFQLLQRRALKHARGPIVYYVFDLLHLDGVSLLEEPIERRKEALAGLMKKAPPGVRLSPVFDVPPGQMLREVERQGLEGLIAKRPASRYEPGRRSGAWLKYRVARDQEFVIGGYTPPGGSRSHIGALLLGYYAGRDLRFAGKVGTGFDQKTLAELHRLLKPHVRRTSAFSDLPGADRGEARRLIGDSPDVVTWLEPRVVCQVRFNEWTEGGRLRQPVYLGLRTDKKAKDVVREPHA